MKIMKSVLSGVLLVSLGLTGTYSANAVDEVTADPATTVFTVTPEVSSTGTTIVMDLPDVYYSRLVFVQVGTKVNGVTKYKTLDHFALWTLDGKVTISSPRKLVKGQILAIRIGGKYVKKMTI